VSWKLEERWERRSEVVSLKKPGSAEVINERR
jgi:hypothetical protein